MVCLVFNTEDILRKLYREQPFVFYKNKNTVLMKRIIGKGSKGRNVQFIFPEKIKIAPSTAGLIIGEGHLGERQFMFANSDEKIIKNILKFLSQFKLSPKFVLEVATKNIGKDFVKRSKKAWENIINEKIEQIRLRPEFNNTTQKGTLHIGCYNVFLAKILKFIIEDIHSKIELKEDLAKEYIKGILAAEGNINVKSTTTNCLYMVRISAKKKEEREHYKRCLERIGIQIYCKDMETIEKDDKRTLHWKTKKGRSGAVLINRWENFYKILLMDLLDLHEDKKRKFIKYFLYNKTTKWLLEFKNLSSKEWFRMKDLKEKFNLARAPIDRVKKMLQLMFLEKSKINNSKIRPFYAFKLTKEYFKFINELSYNSPFSKSHS